MMLRQAILAQAEAIVGSQEGTGKALLGALCASSAAALAARLKEGIHPEDIRDVFIMAAGLHGAASWQMAGQEGLFQEFRAGDLTVKQNAAFTQAGADRLMEQAERLLRPYLKDGFSFTGV